MSRVTPITVVVDSSGSMQEMGKIMVARNIVAFIRQTISYGRQDCAFSSLRMLRWGTGLDEIVIDPDDDVPWIEPGGQAAIRPLLAALKETAEVDAAARILLLSEGLLPKADVAQFAAWRREFTALRLRAIAVGADASSVNLTKVLGIDSVFRPDQVREALNPWPAQDPASVPDSLNDIALLESVREGR